VGTKAVEVNVMLGKDAAFTVVDAKQ